MLNELDCQETEEKPSLSECGLVLMCLMRYLKGDDPVISLTCDIVSRHPVLFYEVIPCRPVVSIPPPLS